MAKGIMVIDIPKSCISCPCYGEDWDDGDEWCRVTGEAIYRYTDDEQCPIKPMPEKYSINHMMHDVDIDVAIGWNTCIDEILGE